MASLVGQQLKDTYDSLLKTSDNDALGVTYKEITDGSGNGSNLYLGTGGNVGIGNTSPDALLHIGGSIPTSAEALNVRGNGPGIYAVSIEQDNPTGYGVLIDTDGTLVSEPALNVKNSSGSMLYVGSNGNVGIGTSSPANDVSGLHISVASSTDQLYLERTGSGTGRYYLGTSNNSFLIVDDAQSAERLRIDSSGNLGIGETSPSAKLEITGTDTEPLTVLNNTVYTFAANVTTSQSNTHTVTIPFTSQASQWGNFLVEIYASANWSDDTRTHAGRALYTFNTLTSINNIAELEDVNDGNLSFSATSSGMNFVVTITTTASSGQEPNRIGVMAKVIRGNGSVGNEPTSMTIA